MGGDRDGNPNVTHDVTRQVFLLGRWMAADLYLRDIQSLRAELSMLQASAELQAVTGDSREPYRQVLAPLRDPLIRTRYSAEASVKGDPADTTDSLFENEHLTAPLVLSYRFLAQSCPAPIAKRPP